MEMFQWVIGSSRTSAPGNFLKCLFSHHPQHEPEALGQPCSLAFDNTGTRLVLASV